MPLKVLMNCSPVVQGGAMQVTQSILTEASRDSRIEYRIIGTSQLKAALDKAKEQVQAAYRQEGFDPAAMFQRLHIVADRGIYTELEAQ